MRTEIKCVVLVYFSPFISNIILVNFQIQYEHLLLIISFFSCRCLETGIICMNVVASIMCSAVRPVFCYFGVTSLISRANNFRCVRRVRARLRLPPPAGARASLRILLTQDLYVLPVPQLHLLQRYASLQPTPELSQSLKPRNPCSYITST